MKTKRSITSDKKIETRGLRKDIRMSKRDYDTFSTYHKSAISVYVNLPVRSFIISKRKKSIKLFGNIRK